MAAANVLTTAATANSSSDTTITVDTVFGLKGAETGSRVFIELKDDGGAYIPVGALTSEEPAKILGPGTWRFRRPAGPSCGVYSA